MLNLLVALLVVFPLVGVLCAVLVRYAVGLRRDVAIATEQLSSVVQDSAKAADWLAEIRDLYSAQLAHVVARRSFTVLVVGMAMVRRSGKESQLEAFLAGVTEHISVDTMRTLSFPAQVPIEAGATVICIGDARLDAVMVGRDICSPFSGLGGSPVCITNQRVEVGAHLQVTVKGTG
jgi:hypothetical protein